RAVLQLLAAEEVRILTLTGPGGVGKTRLALEGAARLAPVFAGDVVWVPLSAVTDSSQVAAAVAHAVGVVESAAATVRDALALALRDRHLLLVVDNFEQVQAAAPLLADL